MDTKELNISIEECKRLVNELPVEYTLIILEFIQKIEQTLLELEKKKQNKEN